MRLAIFIFYIFSFLTYGQHQSAVDFTKLDAEIIPVLKSKSIKGKGIYDFELLSKKDSVFLDAENITFLDVSLNGKTIPYTNSGKKLKFKAPQNLGGHQLSLEYVAKPTQTVYFISKDTVDGPEQVWTQGQGKYTRHWLPSFDDMNEKLEFDLTILADSSYTVISNGLLKKKFPKEGMTAWSFDMYRPMSSYLVAFAMGNFEKERTFSKSGVPIELYYEPKDSLRVEPTYRYSKTIFDFLEEEIGVLYPFQNYKQVPVHDFLYAGMENTTCTIFSNQYVIDSTAFVDKNYVNINAHELAHQWFGNMVTEESGDHHWLHEGFATYYAYLAEREIFGEDYFYWKLYETAKTLHNLSENNDGEALTDPNANSLTFYEKGAWALAMLRERVGDEAFRDGIGNYLNRYAYTNVTIDNFLEEIEISSGQPQHDFREEWLELEEFRFEEAAAFLKKNCPSLRLWFELEAAFEEHQSDDVDFHQFWNAPESTTNFKEALIHNHWRILPKDLLLSVLDSDNIALRKAFAIAVQDAKQFPREIFETLLDDKSYVTIENTLLKLWMAYPEHQKTYLERTSGVEGFPNKNIRLLRLTLAMVTPEIHPDKKKEYYDQLNAYTAPQNHFEVRQLAFQYLTEVKALSDESILHLIEATDHHVWQFKKYARNLVRKLALEDKARFENVIERLSEEKQTELKKIIAN